MKKVLIMLTLLTCCLLTWSTVWAIPGAYDRPYVHVIEMNKEADGWVKLNAHDEDSFLTNFGFSTSSFDIGYYLEGDYDDQSRDFIHIGNITNKAETVSIDVDFLLYFSSMDGTMETLQGDYDVKVVESTQQAEQYWIVIDTNQQAPVPEPTTFCLLGFGLLGLAKVSRGKLKA